MAMGIMGAMSFTSCELDEYNPSAGSSTLENFQTWSGLQTECYSTLYHELYSKEDFLFISECGTDLWLNPAGRSYASQVFYYDGLGVASGQARKTWQQAYSVIATCNSVINNAGGVTGGDPEAVKVLAAEAKVIRAFMHLTLTTYFGPITLCTTEVGVSNTAPVRNSLQDIYNSITTDLKEAAEDLGVQPYGGNYARVTKKSALGLLARAYAQGAGHELTEDGVSYWQRAKEVAEDMINNKAAYGMYLYDDVSDLWAQANNRNNKEALFMAAGLDAHGPDAGMAGSYLNCLNYLYTFTMTDPYTLAQLFKTTTVSNIKSNIYIGTKSTPIMAPTKHAIEVFGDWDKRYENSFMTAFGQFTTEDSKTQNFSRMSKKLTSTILAQYGMNSAYVNDSIYPYAAMKQVESPIGKQNVAVGIYEKGGTQKIVDTKNAFVIEHPLALDEDRITVWLSKEKMSVDQKHQYKCFIMNIDDLFDADGNYTEEQWTPGTTALNANTLFPSLIKFNWNYDGVIRNEGYDAKNGDIAIMRAAEVYMIAAEANVALGNPGAAVPYLKVLRDRAARNGSAPALANPTEQDILDEYAREFVGEHMRWPILKRHNALKSSLEKYNKKAAASFRDNHIYRPIPELFLDQISNKDEYGDNGYGTTANKGY